MVAEVTGIVSRVSRRITVVLVVLLAAAAAAQPSDPGVPVVHRGVELYRIYGPYGLLSAAERAARVEARLNAPLTIRLRPKPAVGRRRRDGCRDLLWRRRRGRHHRR